MRDSRVRMDGANGAKISCTSASKVHFALNYSAWFAGAADEKSGRRPSIAVIGSDPVAVLFDRL